MTSQGTLNRPSTGPERAVTATRSPPAAKAAAMARPMPRLPPVTRTTRPPPPACPRHQPARHQPARHQPARHQPAQRFPRPGRQARLRSRAPTTPWRGSRRRRGRSRRWSPGTVGQQGNAGLGHRARVGRCPNRGAPARPRRLEPGEARYGPGGHGPDRAGGHQVDAHLVRPEVPGQVAGRRLEGGLGHAHPVVTGPGDGGVEVEGHDRSAPGRPQQGQQARGQGLQRVSRNSRATATSSHGA